MLWEVFVRPRRGLSHVHAGSLHADGAWVRDAAAAYAAKRQASEKATA
jgi:ring-1,2-phenylacetyl-CoA epoxidase subunit PaaB